MANQEHVDILKQGVDVWNEWRKENPLVEVDLSEANLDIQDLSQADLHEGNMRWVELRGADLSNANLMGADLTRAHLDSANLNNADLRAVDLSDADLHNTDLDGADLAYANLFASSLHGTRVRHASLAGALILVTSIIRVDLSQTTGLEFVRHRGTSYIDFMSVYLSKGQIPEVFLRGCGLSDLDIEYAKLYRDDLSMEQITDIAYRIAELRGDSALHFHSCFISHATDDKEFVQKLYDDLQDSGVRCWFAPEDMKIGDRIRPTIDQAILVHDKLMIVLSENSIDSSWVEDEVEAAYERENEEGRTILFPLKIDNSVKRTRESWAAKIRRQRHIGDFSNWKDHDAYQQAFERLIQDLQQSVRS